MEPKIDKAKEELVTLAGGVELEVGYRNNGAKEIVKVRQIPVSKIQDFLMSLATNEAVTIELYCDKPKGWADTLTHESATAIADKGQEINSFFFEHWFARQARWGASQHTGVIAELEKKVENLTTQLRSVSSAPQSPITTS